MINHHMLWIAIGFAVLGAVVLLVAGELIAHWMSRP